MRTKIAFAFEDVDSSDFMGDFAVFFFIPCLRVLGFYTSEILDCERKTAFGLERNPLHKTASGTMKTPSPVPNSPYRHL